MVRIFGGKSCQTYFLNSNTKYHCFETVSKPVSTEVRWIASVAGVASDAPPCMPPQTYPSQTIELSGQVQRRF